MADEKFEATVKEALNMFRPQLQADGGDMEDVIYGLFRAFKPTAVLSRDVIFDCPCSRETFGNHIKHLPKSELDDIIAHDNEPIEVVCHCCGSKYAIYKDMLLSAD